MDRHEGEPERQYVRSRRVTSELTANSTRRGVSRGSPTGASATSRWTVSTARWSATMSRRSCSPASWHRSGPSRAPSHGSTGDAQIFAPTATHIMDVRSFFRRYLRDLAAEQHEDGRIPGLVPGDNPHRGETPPQRLISASAGFAGDTALRAACTTTLGRMVPVSRRPCSTRPGHRTRPGTCRGGQVCC